MESRPRESYIGGSDAGAIIGVDEYTTIQTVWKRKMGLTEPFEPNYHMKRGIAMESIIVDRIREEIGEINEPDFITQFESSRDQVFVLKTFKGVPYGGHVDGVAPNRIYEIKAPAMTTLLRWERNGIPKAYVAQMQHYMMASGMDECYFVCMDYNKWALRYVKFYADKDLHREMKDAYYEFWKSVRSGTPPPDINLDIDTSFSPEEMANLDELAHQLKIAKEMKQDAEGIYEECRFQILSKVGDKPVATDRYIIEVATRGENKYLYVK